MFFVASGTKWSCNLAISHSIEAYFASYLCFVFGINLLILCSISSHILFTVSVCYHLIKVPYVSCSWNIKRVNNKLDITGKNCKYNSTNFFRNSITLHWTFIGWFANAYNRVAMSYLSSAYSLWFIFEYELALIYIIQVG